MTRYTISACNFEFDTSRLRDTYDVWTVAICDPSVPDGENVVEEICFETPSERDEYERENDLDWCNTDFTSAVGTIHKHGDSPFYDGTVDVDFHIDYCIAR